MSRYVSQSDSVVHRCDRPIPIAYHDMCQCDDCGQWWLTIDGDYGNRWHPISDRKAVRMMRRIAKRRERAHDDFKRRQQRKAGPE